MFNLTGPDQSNQATIWGLSDCIVTENEDEFVDSFSMSYCVLCNLIVSPQRLNILSSITLKRVFRCKILFIYAWAIKAAVLKVDPPRVVFIGLSLENLPQGCWVFSVFFMKWLLRSCRKPNINVMDFRDTQLNSIIASTEDCVG